ncbi:protein PROCA1 isoform X1 [Peromyscus eremicus]|uniref:protein PROCA1 isoform X1 n=2 Tax=Peromyscus eremicus TaxID=42410 RepID=UPI0027DE92D2|nr:protein PROCA1 isoform X1 [Peromyscus eremicus]
MGPEPGRHFPGEDSVPLAPFSYFVSLFLLSSHCLLLAALCPSSGPHRRGGPSQDKEDPLQMSITNISRLPSWRRGHLASVESSSDVSSLSSEGELQETDRCCWKHQQCAGHIIHPFLDCGHHNRHMHAVSHCDCESRLKDCSGKTNSSRSRDVGPTCSRDRGSTCFNIIHTPCFEFIPEEECVERIWYSWCKGYRPLSVAVIHHPIHHVCRTDNLHEKEDEEDEEEEEETPPSIPTQLCPTAIPTDPVGSVTRTPDSAAPITIWRSESPTEKSQEGKAIKKIKKKKEKEKDNEDEIVDEKAKLKKKVKGKIIKKKSPAKSESSPPDLSRSLSPRELVRTSESSPESREELESEDSYERGKKEPSSEDIVESSPKKREKSTSQAKKNGTKTLQTRKTSKRKSPPVSNPNLS